MNIYIVTFMQHLFCEVHEMWNPKVNYLYDGMTV